MEYLVLYNPGHNRVYFESSLKLAIAEFNIVAQKLSCKCEHLENKTIFGIEYLSFQVEKELPEYDIEILSNLSFTYAIFKSEIIEEQLFLKPIEKIKNDFVNESFSTILKYTGKTNELFTRMMLNIAYYSQSNTKGIKLLDPVAGKGTTLYEGLIKGFDSYGIEIGDAVVNESYHFIKRFLENARYKYEYKEIRISGPKKTFTAVRHTFETAKTKEEYKNNSKTIELISGNSQYTNQYYKKNFFDIIVGDLPYGVQHSNVTNEKQSSFTRNPFELLTVCLPSWIEVLKPNGVIVLSWNSNVLPRKKLKTLLEENNLTVEESNFEHMVSSSIQRDIVVARKTS